MKRMLAVGVVVAAAFTAACKPPKYIDYSSEAGDFSASVPWGWSVYLDRQADDYYNYTFVGPFEPEFHHGVPTLQVRWYGKNRVRTLPDGQLETYASAKEYIERTLRDVYGPERELEVAPHPLTVAGWQATHFVVVGPMDVSSKARFGVYTDPKSKRTLVARRHAYVVLPMDNGFYVMIYPATWEGFKKYEDRFNSLVRSFRVLKDGPGGPLLKK